MAKRRANGGGHLRQRPNGTWELCLMIGFHDDGRRKYKANDLIRKNPVRFAEKMRNREPIKRKDAFTTEQVAILMEKLPEDRMGLSIRLMLGTGMRTQEILALEPRHIEPDGSVIRIEQAINMYKGTGVVGTPKSRDSYRSIPVPESLRYCAIALRNTDKKFIWEVRKKDCPCNPTHFRDQFKKTLQASKRSALLQEPGRRVRIRRQPADGNFRSLRRGELFRRRGRRAQEQVLHLHARLRRDMAPVCV